MQASESEQRCSICEAMTRKNASHLVLCGLGLLTLGAVTSLRGAMPHQEPGPTFKSGAVTVPVYATVTDLNHRLVTTLSADDFVVLDDGRPQPLKVFEKNVQPISVVLLLDASESMRQSIGLLQAAAKQFVNNLLPSDRVLLGAFNEKIRWVPPFTNNRNTLNLALDYFGPKKSTSEPHCGRRCTRASGISAPSTAAGSYSSSRTAKATGATIKRSRSTSGRSSTT